MRKLKRRDFLKYAGIGGVLLFSKINPLSLVENAFSEDVREVKLNASITTVNVGTGKSYKHGHTTVNYQALK